MGIVMLEAQAAVSLLEVSLHQFLESLSGLYRLNFSLRSRLGRILGRLGLRRTGLRRTGLRPRRILAFGRVHGLKWLVEEVLVAQLAHQNQGISFVLPLELVDVARQDEQARLKRHRHDGPGVLRLAVFDLSESHDPVEAGEERVHLVERHSEFPGRIVKVVIDSAATNLLELSSGASQAECKRAKHVHVSKESEKGGKVLRSYFSEFRMSKRAELSVTTGFR